MVSASFLNAVLRGERSQICPYMLSAKQGSIWYRFYNVFGMTRSGIEHTTSRSRGERSNHRATAATFGSMVKPILYYASQIWGYAYMYVYTIESVHNRFCKIFFMYVELLIHVWFLVNVVDYHCVLYITVIVFDIGANC